MVASSVPTSIRLRASRGLQLHRESAADDCRDPGVPGGEAQTLRGRRRYSRRLVDLVPLKALNALIAEALANNADLKAAQAALLVAHETPARSMARICPR